MIVGLAVAMAAEGCQSGPAAFRPTCLPGYDCGVSPGIVPSPIGMSAGADAGGSDGSADAVTEVAVGGRVVVASSVPVVGAIASSGWSVASFGETSARAVTDDAGVFDAGSVGVTDGAVRLVAWSTASPTGSARALGEWAAPSAASVELVVVPVSVLQTAVLGMTAVDPMLSHVVVQFGQSTRNLSGISVDLYSLNGVRTDSVRAYDVDGASFALGAVATGSRGTALLLDVVAPATGTAAVLEVRTATATRRYAITLAAGHVEWVGLQAP